MKKLVYGALLLSLTGCGVGGTDNGTKDKATAEQEASTAVQNKNQAQLAEKMENDLAARHQFYGALEGKYEGTVMVDRDAYSMRLVLTRSIPPYRGNRVRQLSEIESDLNNLHFNVQVVQWHPSDPASAVGCRMTGIKPDTNKGTVTLTSGDCANAYRVFASQGSSQGSRNEDIAQGIASQINSGAINRVDSLVGTVQPTWNARTFTFDIKRVQ